MSKTKDWYETTGYIQINNILIEYVNENIGWIPLQNLLDIQDYDDSELANLLSHDGVITAVIEKELFVKVY